MISNGDNKMTTDSKNGVLKLNNHTRNTEKTPQAYNKDKMKTEKRKITLKIKKKKRLRRLMLLLNKGRPTSKLQQKLFSCQCQGEKKHNFDNYIIYIFSLELPE